MADKWTPENEKILRDMWAAGNSYTEIAKAIGNGTTRNAVGGKVVRLKLPRRVNVVTPKVTKPPKPKLDFTRIHFDPEMKKAPEVIKNEEVTETGFDIGNVGPNQCRWIFAQPSAEAAICGKAAKGPYCPDHRSRCYVVAKKADLTE